ncbi:MAG: hypothetical protein KA998_04400 [Rickettsiaceae bacterium]|nr:hypothetical protein [Rickettsiaceae bacterium]
MSDIKEYFQLEDIVLYRAKKNDIINLESGAYRQNLISKYLGENMRDINYNLKNSTIVRRTINSEQLKSIIYVTKSLFLEGVDYIAFVHSLEEPLNKSDMEILGGPVKLILSGALGRKMFL